MICLYRGGDNDQFDAADRPTMLGNIPAVESLMKGDKITPPRTGRQRPVLVVHATFEESRLAATYLATAYEQAVPVRHRSATSARLSTSSAQAGHTPVDRMGF